MCIGYTQACMYWLHTGLGYVLAIHWPVVCIVYTLACGMYWLYTACGIYWLYTRQWYVLAIHRPVVCIGYMLACGMYWLYTSLWYVLTIQ